MMKKEFLDFAMHFKDFDHDTVDDHSNEILELLLKRFNELSKRDRLSILLTSANGVNHVCPVNDKVDVELADIEKENKLEMIRLKTWIIKVIVVLTVLGSTAAGAIILVSGGPDSTAVVTESISTVTKLFELFFK